MPCPVCGAGALMLAPGTETVLKYACGWTPEDVNAGRHPAPPKRGITFSKSDKRALSVLMVILLVVFWYVVVRDIPDHSISATTSSSAFEFDIINDGDGPIAYLLEVDGVDACQGELGASMWNKRATCTSPIRWTLGAEADLVITVQRSTGQAYQEISGTADEQRTTLHIKNFSAEKA